MIVLKILRWLLPPFHPILTIIPSFIHKRSMHRTMYVMLFNRGIFTDSIYACHILRIYFERNLRSVFNSIVKTVISIFSFSKINKFAVMLLIIAFYYDCFMY